MFLAEIAAIVCAIIAIIPIIGIVGGIGAIVCSVVTIYGLFEVKKDIPEVQNAFYCAIANVVVSIIANLGITFLSGLCDIVSTVLGLLVLFFLLNPVAGALRSVGRADVAAYGEKIWTINLICTVVSVICAVIAIIPFIGPIVAGLVGFVVAIASIVAGIMYIIYLKKASEALA